MVMSLPSCSCRLESRRTSCTWGSQVGSGRWTDVDHLRLRKRRLAPMLVDSQQDAADGFGVEPSAPKGARHAGQGHVPLAIPYWAAQYVSRDCAAVGRVDPDVDVAWQGLRHLREFFKPVAQVRMKAFYDNRTRLTVLPVVRPGHPEDPGAIVDGIA